MYDDLQFRLNTERSKTLLLEAERERLVKMLAQSQGQRKDESKRG